MPINLSASNLGKRILYNQGHIRELLKNKVFLEGPYLTGHTAATLWLAAGESLEWIARQVGHTTTEILFRVYSRYVPNLTRQDGSAFERLLLQNLSVSIAIAPNTDQTQTTPEVCHE